jgi:hypothetical protein
MRGAWVMLVSFGLCAPVRADVSVGVAKPGPAQQAPAPEWWRTCRDALEDARQALAKTDPHMADAFVALNGGSMTASPDCEHDREPSVMLARKSGGGAFFAIEHGADRSQPWTMHDRPMPWDAHYQCWKRYESGRAYAYVTADPAHPMTAERLRQALDVCIAVAPRVEPPPPTANDGEAAANELERACSLDIRAPDVTSLQGRTKPRLARLLALGPRALPLLLRLAHGRNVAARATAALGLAQFDDKAAREALRQLARDQAEVDVYGVGTDLPRTISVASIAAGKDPFSF